MRIITLLILLNQSILSFCQDHVYRIEFNKDYMIMTDTVTGKIAVESWVDNIDIWESSPGALVFYKNKEQISDRDWPLSFFIDWNNQPFSSVSEIRALFIRTTQTIVVNATGSDLTLVSAVTDRKIRVVSAYLYADDQSSIRFESNTGGTALTGIIPLFSKQGGALDPGASNGKIEWLYNEAGYIETNSGELLNLETGSGDVHGIISYVIVP